MTVSSEISEVSYDTDGVTTAFPVPFYFLANAQLRVWLFYEDTGVETDLVLGSSYLVTGAGNPAGGTVTTSTAYPAGPKLRIERVVPITQETAYQRNDPFPERAHERALDKLTMICQQLAGFFGLLPGSTLRALLLGRNDVDGQGAYRARNNRIQDLADPKADQDAVNWRSMFSFVTEYVDKAISGVVGGFGWFLQAGVGATFRTFQSKMRDTVSIKDFGAVGDGVTDDGPALVKAIASLPNGGSVVFPAGENYVIRNKVPITQDGITLSGYGATIIIGAGELAGTRIIEVNANRFSAIGFRVVDGGTRVAAFAIVTTDAEKENFTFRDMDISGCFYAVRPAGQPSALVKNILVDNIKSIAPPGANASHIVATNADGYTVVNCDVFGGTNSSQIGCATSKNIVIANNRCFGNEGTDPADTAIQIENCPNANAVITGNVCDHDIWVDDSTHVTIGPNTAKWLRFTVTIGDNHTINCTGGIYGRINAQSIGTPGAFRTSARFTGIVLDPAKFSQPFAINASGTYVGKMSFNGVQIVSNGTTANVNISRNASAAYRFRNCNFNGGAVTISGGSLGTVSLRDNEGYVTEASGNGTIGTGATSVVITHGCSRQPALQDITITRGTNPANDIGAVWVSAITSTTFTVNCTTAPGSPTLQFGWHVGITRDL